MESGPPNRRLDPAVAQAIVDRVLLPHVPREPIVAAYLKAQGNEILSGKFASRESSAALVANAFGIFVDSPQNLPPLPGLESLTWPAKDLRLEACVRFPWAGGLHPYLDVLIRTHDALIGIESKRFEPFRGKSPREESEAYKSGVWGNQMSGYRQLWDQITGRGDSFAHLDAKQLIKHAFALRTQIHRIGDERRRGVLYYLYTEPASWPDGQTIDWEELGSHRQEIDRFSTAVVGDEVTFVAQSYETLLTTWLGSNNATLAAHATALCQWAGTSVRGNRDVSSDSARD